jgi:hypothetical protein
MQFTHTETKAIERLQRARRSWPKFRLFLLINPVVHIALCIMGWQLLRIAVFAPENEERLLLAKVANGEIKDTKLEMQILAEANQHLMYYNKAFIGILLFGVAFGVMGFFELVIVVRDWRGNSTQLLLLKLLEAQQNGEAKLTETAKQS